MNNLPDSTAPRPAAFGEFDNELALQTLGAVREPFLVLNEALVVVAANAPFLHAFRVGREETIGKRVYELGNGQWNLPALRLLLEELLPSRGQIDNFEVEHEFPEIGLRSMFLNARLIPEAELILLAMEDVTERKQAQLAVSRAREQAEKTIDTVREPMLVLGHDLRVQSANQAFYEVFRVGPEDTLGEVVYDLGNGQWDIPALHALLEDVLPDNHVFNDFIVEHNFENLGRRSMLLNARRIDHVQLVLLAFEDITERQRAAEELKASEARFRSLFEQTSVGVCEVDPATGRLISANYTLCKMLGSLEMRLVGKTLAELTYAADSEAAAESFQRLVRGELSNHQTDKRLARSDGSPLWVHETLNLLVDRDGLPSCVIGIAIDIKERKEAEAAMSEALKAKDEFLGLISHELRTPLTIIRGNALTLSKRAGLDESSKSEALLDIATESGRLARIIDNMLYLARLEAGKEPELEPVLLSHVVQDETSEFQRRHPAAAIVVAELDPGVVVEANEEYLRRILENLLSNAVKYGGLGQPIEVRSQVAGDFARVAVADRGIGVKGGDTELFEPFYRESEDSSGLGIGLTVCKRLVEAQGGEIHASRREGGGSVFSFSVPLALQAVGEP